MRCLFCKNESHGSRSVEHIIPESLGNHTLTLAAGVVCDKCNNYFARKVERPFLDLPALADLRFHQEIPNKRNRIPPIDAVLLPDAPATVYRHPDRTVPLSVFLPPESALALAKSGEGILMLPMARELPTGPIVSRFLAKVALEAMAHRLQADPAGLDYLVSERQLDDIRRHAREGRISEWPFHVRRIYDASQCWTDRIGEDRQVVHESDVLVTDDGEWYFVLALFGLELTINYGGPEIDGYLGWLQRHDNVSPLHWGKNSVAPALRQSK